MTTIASPNLYFFHQPATVAVFHNFLLPFVNSPPAASLAPSIPASIHQKRKVGLCPILAYFLLPAFCLLSNLDTPDLYVEWVDGPQVPVDARALQIWCQSANPLSPNPIAVQNILLNTIRSRRCVGSGISFFIFHVKLFKIFEIRYGCVLLIFIKNPYSCCVRPKKPDSSNF
ncbi:Hypothetical_protein [Hexamita inflata]|uniref:Hypothetical_protein n=1 Tax=Hexamita inflata TaxID=28002 RepID=A0AA86PC47_9EUKA|nr:Hypothetical protein HINF_LOCUS23869 [Hexamita inflata]